MQLLKSLSGLLLAFVSTTVLSAPLNTTGYFSVAESRTFEQQFAPHKWSSVGDAKVKTDGSTASAYLSASSTFGDREGLAQADLAAATLKAYSYAGSNTEMTAGSVGISSRAAFADSFSITSPSGSPFVWSSGEMVTFNLTVSGLSDYSPQLSDWVGSWLRLHVFAPGTLSTSSLGTVDPQSALQSFSWGLTPDTTWDIDLKTGKFLTINTVADGSSVSASFSPGGDFDWYIELMTSIGILNGDPTAYAVLDFSHTVGVSYQGPAGSNTYSKSGIFPGTLSRSSVPEPETYSMVIAGFGLAVLMGRRRKSVKSAVCSANWL